MIRNAIYRKTFLFTSFISLISSIILFSITAFAATIHVPEDQPTIQEGIDAAIDGDTVSVADGNYSGEGNFDIDFKGKTITVQSENGPDNCTIDCEKRGRGFIFLNKESRSTVLSGFTIKNGLNGHIYAFEHGGGIYCVDSSPTITNCVISNNTSVSKGGGIYFRNSHATLSNCIIRNNTANWYGGGIGCSHSYRSQSHLNITNCSIEGNVVDTTGGGISISMTPVIMNNCHIVNNSSNTRAGGMYWSQSSPVITNCVIAANTAGSNGAGVYIDNACGNISSCTITGNIANEDGGAIASSNAAATIENCILWGNDQKEIHFEDTDAAIIVVNNSLIQGGFVGDGNFHGDPVFVDPENGDYHLGMGSPCIDKGSSKQSPDSDIEGILRPQGLGVDIGAHEAHGYADSRPVIESFEADPHEINIPYQVTYTCLAYDSDGEIVSYSIDYGDGTPSETNSTGIFTHIYNTDTGYATCSVTDDSGNVVYSKSLHVLANGIIRVPVDEPTIQAGIDAATHNVNMTVLLDNGTYKGKQNRNLDFNGKAITVRSENGPESCIIHCERAGRGFVFQNWETEHSIVSGVTIMYGIPTMTRMGHKDGAGIHCFNASPSINNCIITKNRGGYTGGGIYCWNASPKISDCEITENWAGQGGGIRCISGSPTITNCIISRNVAMAEGVPGAITAGGGGINCYTLSATPILTNCVISNNISFCAGGGIYGSHSAYTLTNCTISGNIAYAGAGGIFHFEEMPETSPVPNISNCIIWGNIPNGMIGLGLFSETYNLPAVYCDVQEENEGEGNISAPPLFLNSDAEDFHLSPDSPCIDTATFNGAPAMDIEGTSRPQAGSIDMGAYEMPEEDPSKPEIDSFTSSSTEGDIPFEVAFTCLAQDHDGSISNYSIDYGDGSPTASNNTGIFTHTFIAAGKSVVKCTVMDDSGNSVQSKPLFVISHGNIHVPANYPNIQEGIDAASNGDTVLVADGIYKGSMNKNLNFYGKTITVKSANGPENCIIDCENDGRGVCFENYESNTSLLSGFTITNGLTEYGGGGIRCRKSSPTITDCIIQGNKADDGIFGGGGICCAEGSSPTIMNCIIRENWSNLPGGGVYCTKFSYPLITYCKIFGNSTEMNGGGLCNFTTSASTILDCVFSANQAKKSGGGISSASSYLIISNTMITGNTAGEQGGGLYCIIKDSPGLDEDGNNAIIINSTIANNNANEGGGIYFRLNSPATIKNSILWKNMPHEISYDVGSGMFTPTATFCNIDGGYPGESNFDRDPLFVDPENGNYHLTLISPCLEAGTSNGAPQWDIDGDLRPQGIQFDIGADEYLYGDEDEDYLPDSLEMSSCTSPLLTDTDNDGIIDGIEDRNQNGNVDPGESDPCLSDTDEDGIPDGVEDANQNGEVDPGETDPCDSDTDNDLMDDGWESRYLLDPLTDDADGHADEDGYNNLEEYNAGTDPTDPTEYPDIPPDPITDLKVIVHHEPHYDAIDRSTIVVNHVSQQSIDNDSKKSIDNDLNSYWSSGGTQEVETEYIIYDLGEIKQIGKIEIFLSNRKDLFPKDIKVSVAGEYLSDKTAWGAVVVNDNFSTSKDSVTWEFLPREVRYIKISGHSIWDAASTEYAVEIAEIKIYQCYDTANSLSMSWTAPEDPEDYQVAEYQIQYKQIGDLEWQDVDEGIIPSAPETQERYVLCDLAKEAEYEVRICSGDTYGNWSDWAITSASTTQNFVDGIILLTPCDEEIIWIGEIPEYGWAGDIYDRYVVQFSNSPAFPNRAIRMPNGSILKTLSHWIRGQEKTFMPTTLQWKNIKKLATEGGEGTLYWRVQGKTGWTIGYSETRHQYDLNAGAIIPQTPAEGEGIGLASPPEFSWTYEGKGIDSFSIEIAVEKDMLGDRREGINYPSFFFKVITETNYVLDDREWKVLKKYLSKKYANSFYWRVKGRDADRVFQIVSPENHVFIDCGSMAPVTPADGETLGTDVPPTLNFTYYGAELSIFQIQLSTVPDFSNSRIAFMNPNLARILFNGFGYSRALDDSNPWALDDTTEWARIKKWFKDKPYPWNVYWRVIGTTEDGTFSASSDVSVFRISD